MRLSGLVGLWSQTGSRPKKVARISKGKRLIFMAVMVQVVFRTVALRGGSKLLRNFVFHYAVSQPRKPQLVGEEQCSSSTVCRVKGRVITAQSVG